MGYKTIALKPGTYDQLAEAGTTKESFDDVILKLLASYRQTKVLPPPKPARANQSQPEDHSEAISTPLPKLWVPPVMVTAEYKVCLPETVLKATGDETGHCGYRRQGRYCIRTNRRPAACWLDPATFANLPVERATIGDNPPYG